MVPLPLAGSGTALLPGALVAGSELSDDPVAAILLQEVGVIGEAALAPRVGELVLGEHAGSAPAIVLHVEDLVARGANVLDSVYEQVVEVSAVQRVAVAAV